MSERPARLVVFDLGRVLMRICDGWRHACEVAGVPVPRNELDDAARARVMQFVMQNEVGRMDQAEFARAAAPVLGLEDAHVIALSNAYLLGPFDGAGELIDDLRGEGVVTACMSNTNANHWRILTDAADAHGRVVNRLDHRFASHLVGARKPDERIYAHVERETGAEPASIIFFDDLPENLPPAEARGWRTHLVERSENPIPMIREALRRDGVLR
jgi:putative hydrolase of the HAD superfamily